METKKRLHITPINYIQTSSSKSIIGFSRSILAAGVLLKLSFNNINLLFPVHQLQAFDLNSFKYRCNFFFLFNSFHVAYMQVFAIIILGLIVSGYFMQITCLFHFWISASFFMLRPVSIGVDNIEMLLTLLLIPVCLFDERKNHWHQPVSTNKFNNLIQNIFLFFIKLQVAFIYYDSFHDKLFIKEWLNGTVIYYWFTHNFFGLDPLVIKILYPVLTSIPALLLFSWGALVFEILLAVAFLFPNRFKLLFLKCGIIFHFIILLVHGFSFLFFAMSACLFLYLYPAKKSFSLAIINEK